MVIYIKSCSVLFFFFSSTSTSSCFRLKPELCSLGYLWQENQNISAGLTIFWEIIVNSVNNVSQSKGWDPNADHKSQAGGPEMISKTM